VNAADLVRVATDALSAIVREAVAPLEAKIDRQNEIIETLKTSTPGKLVTVAEGRRLTGFSDQTLRTYAKAGRIPSIRVGRAIRLDISALRGPDAATVQTLADASRASR
jgi:Flp pilus assembly protein TadD